MSAAEVNTMDPSAVPRTGLSRRRFASLACGVAAVAAAYPNADPAVVDTFEIGYLKGKRNGFAPHWLPPDRVAHALRRIVPLWAPAAVLAVVGLLGYFGLNAWLGRDTDRQLAAHQDIVQLPQQTARITITLP